MIGCHEVGNNKRHVRQHFGLTLNWDSELRHTLTNFLTNFDESLRFRTTNLGYLYPICFTQFVFGIRTSLRSCCGPQTHFCVSEGPKNTHAMCTCVDMHIWRFSSLTNAFITFNVWHLCMYACTFVYTHFVERDLVPTLWCQNDKLRRPLPSTQFV